MQTFVLVISMGLFIVLLRLRVMPWLTPSPLEKAYYTERLLDEEEIDQRQQMCIDAFFSQNEAVFNTNAQYIAIYNQMDNSEVAGFFYDYTPLSETLENQLEALEESNAPARLAFAEFNQSLLTAYAFHKLGKIDTPMAADIYQIPIS